MQNITIQTLGCLAVVFGLASCSSDESSPGPPDPATDAVLDVLPGDTVADGDSNTVDTGRDGVEEVDTGSDETEVGDSDSDETDTGDTRDDEEVIETGPCACAARNRCSNDVLPAVGLLLPVVEETAYWVAYESPSPFALSLAWGNDHLWVSDLLRGYIAEFNETDDGLELLRVDEPPRDPFGQARDMTFDDEKLWTIDWGSLIRHNSSDLSVDTWVTEGEIGSPNLHHMRAIAWDGTRLWSALSGALYEHSTDDHTVETTHGVDLWGSVVGMTFFEEDLWVSNRSGGFIERYDPDSLELVDRYSIVAQPFGITASETHLWVYDWVTRRIYKIKELPTIPLDPQNRYLDTDTFTVPANMDSTTATWTLAESPYKLESGFGVPEGHTLTIEAGVEVYIGQTFGVAGTLIAEGEPDAPILFTHIGPLDSWGGFSFSPGSHNSVLRYVDVLYATDGLKFEDVVIQPIVGCTIQKAGVDPLFFQLREPGDYNAIELRGNRLEQSGGVGLKITLGDGVNVPAITFIENSTGYLYASGLIVESESGAPPESGVGVRYEHNIAEYGFRGVGGGTPGLANLVFRNNHLMGSVSGSGIQPFNGGNELSHNLIEYTSEQAYQLHPGHLVTDTEFTWNTVRAGGFDTDWGDDSVVVSNNNLLALPWYGRWIDAEQEDTQIRNNWWGTTDLDFIRDQILDGYWLESNGQQADRGYVETEPILDEPNGIGFVQGTIVDSDSLRPIRGAEVVVGDLTTHTAADGRYFSSAPQGDVAISVAAEGFSTLTLTASVCSGELTELSQSLEAE